VMDVIRAVGIAEANYLRRRFDIRTGRSIHPRVGLPGSGDGPGAHPRPGPSPGQPKPGPNEAAFSRAPPADLPLLAIHILQGPRARTRARLMRADGRSLVADESLTTILMYSRASSKLLIYWCGRRGSNPHSLAAEGF
jgi:hypothetical protein